MSTLLTSELRSDVSSAYYTTARYVGQSCTDDILSKSTRKLGGMTSQATSTSSEDNRFKNTRMCVFFQKGACSKGEHCTYAHSTEQLKSAPNLLKTRLCQDWLNGRCVTPNCRFAHGRQELRFTFDYYKTKLCHFWQNGGCTKGSLCRHAHGEEELRPMPPDGLEGAASSSSASTADEITPQQIEHDANLMSEFNMTAAALAAMTACADFMNIQSAEKPQNPRDDRQNELGISHHSRSRSIHAQKQFDEPSKDARQSMRGVGPIARDRRTGSALGGRKKLTEESFRTQSPGKYSVPARYVDSVEMKNSRSSDTENLVKAVRLAQAARELANKSNDIIRRVAEAEALSGAYFMPTGGQTGSFTPGDSAARNSPQNMRHSVACPTDFQISACANLSESRLWDYRHSAPECDLESLAKKLLPLLTEPEELQLTSKLGACQREV